MGHDLYELAQLRARAARACWEADELIEDCLTTVERSRFLLERFYGSASANRRPKPNPHQSEPQPAEVAVWS